MLIQRSSQTPFVGGLIEHECSRCHREVELPFGAICGQCVNDIERRSRQLGRRLALVSTLILGLYVSFKLPVAGPGRNGAILSVGAWYVLTYMMGKRFGRAFFQ